MVYPHYIEPRVISPGVPPGRFHHPKRHAALWAVLAALAIILSLAACGSRSSSGQEALCVAGSTSVQPFAEKLAEIYMQEHPTVRIEVQGGGSSAGVYAARQGAADLGACSRELTPKEKDLVEIPIAWDGIAIIVNANNPLASLSMDVLRQIYAGKVADWGELGLPAHAIHLITREEGSGTRNAFEELVMGKVEITPAALVQDSNGSVREIVANDPNALGYISVGLVEGQVKAVAVDGVAPSRQTIKEHKYKLVRRFLLVSRLPPQGPVKEFVDFILSAKGQSILEQEGLVGIEE